jgi:hypothetical protein
MKNIVCLVIVLILSAVQNASAQQFSDAKMNEFILMDKDENGMFEVFVNPMHFDCECEEVISILFSSKVPNKYISKDENITIVVNGKKATVTVKNATKCCLLKAGIYSVD